MQENKITTIVIAHRLSTIKDADCIYVLRKGEVCERGSHDKLLDKKGVYSSLVQTQLAAEEQIEDVEDMSLDRKVSKKA